MINNILTYGKYVSIINNGESTPYIDMSRPSAGMMRMNGSTMEVYDGFTWLSLNNTTPSFGLTLDAESALDWVKEQKAQQEKRELLIENNPALKIAYDRIKKAEADFEILEKIVEHDAVIE